MQSFSIVELKRDIDLIYPLYLLLRYHSLLLSLLIIINSYQYSQNHALLNCLIYRIKTKIIFTVRVFYIAISLFCIWSIDWITEININFFSRKQISLINTKLKLNISQHFSLPDRIFNIFNFQCFGLCNRVVVKSHTRIWINFVGVILNSIQKLICRSEGLYFIFFICVNGAIASVFFVNDAVNTGWIRTPNAISECKLNVVGCSCDCASA